jgi:hypothetical protein
MVMGGPERPPITASDRCCIRAASIEARAMSGNPSDTTAPSAARLLEILIGQREAAVRLGENHYLVRWEPRSSMWCLINMAGLDEHAEICSRFRFRKSCDHLDLVSDLCSREKASRGTPR